MSHTSHAFATSQPADRPPFSGKIKVDTELKLNHDSFKEPIEQFYVNKQLSAIDQLKETPPYPTPHVLAQFASMAYRDFKHEDPKPPKGWQLLTTASNTGNGNGYFGTAYWHPEHQQVVIAHRGTQFKNAGPLVTDFNGVLLNNYVQQMSSASTFANKVVAVLQEIEQEMKVSFELFFTGHSLGGWLAQITNFATEYLEVKGYRFLKKGKRDQEEPFASSTVKDIHHVKQSYHAHTVVFDSPGCEGMLLKMKKTFDVRNKGRSIDLQHLDITSYLSAPNRINTCKTHVGTVYRIFIDLSDMDWKKKHTLLYNKATHSMDKILQTFDPETGQVRKDEKGELKIRQVVDWPVSSGLTGGAELKKFFKWAEPFPNYHPDVMGTVHSNMPEDYHPIRYQTKAFDECSKSLSVFTLDEREFLERYCWLRDIPEFFKPEDLFCVMDNAEAEKEAQQKLRNFKLDNESVRCPDTSILHAMIPFVKRLLRLFPHLKENVEKRMSSSHIRNRVYQHETQRYVEKIDKSALDFKPGSLDVIGFLTRDKKIWQLRMIDGDAWSGITKVYRVLQKTSCKSNYFREGHYTILETERLLTVNGMINFNALITSMETPHLLMLACGTNQTDNNELENMFQELLYILEQKKSLKIILTTQSESDIADFIDEIATETFGEGFITTYEQLTWSDLTANSQREMLEKTVVFQGMPVALNQLTSVELMSESLLLADFLQETELKIGEDPIPSACNGYNEEYHIDRSFNHNIFISKDIISDKEEETLDDILAYTEEEFKQLCQQNPTNNVHWLMKDESGELIWQQSQGKLKSLHKYIDAQKPQSNAPLDKMLQQAKQQRVMIIADTAGMGKTTILTHLSKQIKQIYPAHWLVRIDLNVYTKLLKAQKGKKVGKNWVLEFVSKEVLKLKSHFEKELFQKCFERNGIRKIVVMVDGFDEISPDYKETVLDMLQVLKHTSLEQLWVTTRPHLKEELEDNLQQLSYTLQPFSEFEQVEYLKKLWLQQLNLEDINQRRLKIFADALIRKLAQSISDKNIEFTGIPLQTRMLAEAFGEDFSLFYLSEKSEPELPQKLDLLGLYRKFIERKYNIYYEEKCLTPAGNVSIQRIHLNNFEQQQEKHELLALEALFTEDQLPFMHRISDKEFEELAGIGIVQKKNEGKPQFIHRTFAEYYVAEFLIKQLTKKTEQNTHVQDFLLNVVLLRRECQVIRALLDELLKRSKPLEQALKDCGEKLDKQWNDREANGSLTFVTTALHQAAAGDNVHIVGFLLDSLNSGEHSKATKKMLLARDDKRRTACHMAAGTNSVQALKKIWEWAEAVTPTLTYSLLLSQDKDKKNAWQLAAEGGRIEMVEKLWSWAKETETKHGELQNKLLLVQDSEGRTVLQLAAQRGSVDLIDKLWIWAKEELPDSHLLKNKLLLSRDKNGINAWHIAAKTGNVVILGKLWDWTKELQLELEELRKEVWVSRDKSGQTAWHMAAEGGHVEVLEKLWDCAKEEKLNTDYLKSALFLSEDSRGFSTWRSAVYNGHVQLLEKMWIWADEMQLPHKELSKLLLAVDSNRNTAIYWAAGTSSIELLDKLWGVWKETQLNTDELSKKLDAAWHVAAAEGYLEILERLWLWVGEVQRNPHGVQRRLLLEQSKDGKSVWHMAAAGRHIKVLEKLWGWAKDVQINSDCLKSLLFEPQDNCGFSTWCYAIREVRTDVIQKLWGWAEELQLTAEELKNKLFLAVDRDGNSAIYWAAYTGSLELLETMWELSKETQLNPDELSKLLVAAWQMAAAGGYLEILERLWLWAGEVQRNPHELKIRLLLEQIKNGKSAWHMAAAEDQVEVLEKLWGWAKGVQINQEQLTNDFFLDEYGDGKFAWHKAEKWENVELSDNLLGLSDETKINADDRLSAMMLVWDKLGNTTWNLVVRYGRVKVLQTLLNWAQEMHLNPSEVRNKLLLNLKEDGKTAWFLAAKSGNRELLQELWVLGKEKETSEEIKSKLLLAKNEYGQTALHVAAEGSVAVLEKLWAFATEAQLSKEEVKNNLLLAKDQNGNTVWHQAAERGSLEALETLWNWGKEVNLNPDELLLVQNEERQTVYHLAADRNDEGMLQKLWILARQAQVNIKEIKNKLLILKDKSGNTVWHTAAKRGHVETLEALWSCAKDAQLNSLEFLSAKEKDGRDSSQVASQRFKLGVLEELWVGAKEAQMYKKDLKKKLILAKDMHGKTAWQEAASKGNLEALETLWSWAKEAELNTDELLLAQTAEGYTAFQLAAENKHVETLKNLWDCAEETQLNPNELKNKLFLNKNNDGFIAWHRAAKGGSLEALETLWSWAKKIELNTDELLLIQSKDGITSFQLAAAYNHVETLNKIWIWAEEKQLKTNELKNKLLLATDTYGQIAWHRAAVNGSLQTLEKLWIWAKEMELNTNELLLAQTLDGCTAFHMAAENNHVETLKKQWFWAEEKQLNPNELKRKIFLAKDKLGYIAWHRAAAKGNLQALETLWSCAEKVGLNTDELLLAQSEEGVTSFQLAAGGNYIVTLKNFGTGLKKSDSIQMS